MFSSVCKKGDFSDFTLLLIREPKLTGSDHTPLFNLISYKSVSP